MKGARLSLIVSAAALLALVPASVWAQRGSDPVLSLGVQASGKYDPKLSASLREALTKGGELLVQDGKVSPAERLCTNAECMTQLGGREGAKLVLSTQLRPSGAGSQYLTTVVFDVTRRVPHDEHGVCDRCSPELLNRAISELAERSLRIGDMVRVDNFDGRVADIRTRYTVIRALSGREAIVPNEMLITQRVENLSLADMKVLLSTGACEGWDDAVEGGGIVEVGLQTAPDLLNYLPKVDVLGN